MSPFVKNIQDLISLMTRQWSTIFHAWLYFTLHLFPFHFPTACINACVSLYIPVSPSFHCLPQSISLLSVCNFRNKLPSKCSCISSVSNSCNWVINDGCRLDIHMLLETGEYRNCMSHLRLASGCIFFSFFLLLLYFLYSEPVAILYWQASCGEARLKGSQGF